jgi:hypothetical protein
MNRKLGCLHRWLPFLELLVMVTLIVACAHPPVTVTPQPDAALPFQAFATALDNHRERLRIPGMSVAVLRDQEIVFKKGFGHADIDKQIPATATTAYHLASLTKPFSAAVIMRLVEKGRLTLDDEMSALLKDAEIHRSGYRAHGYAQLCEVIRGLIWHYGHVPKTVSSLILKVPEQQLTMILLANSDGASRNFNLGKGDVLNSPFARLFLAQVAGIDQTIR